MKHLRRALPLALLLALATPSDATTVIHLDDDALCARADEIFHGTCVDVRAELDPRGRIVTRYTFSVTEGLKGVPGTSVELLQPGGTLGGRTLLVPGAASFTPAEEAVVFVGPRCPRTGCAFTLGLAQGKFSVRRRAGVAPAAVRDLSGLEVVGAQGAPAHEERALDDLLGTIRTHVRR